MRQGEPGRSTQDGETDGKRGFICKVAVVCSNTGLATALLKLVEKKLPAAQAGISAQARSARARLHCLTGRNIQRCLRDALIAGPGFLNKGIKELRESTSTHTCPAYCCHSCERGPLSHPRVRPKFAVRPPTRPPFLRETCPNPAWRSRNPCAPATDLAKKHGPLQALTHDLRGATYTK